MQHTHGQDNFIATVCVLVGSAVVCAVSNAASRVANIHRNRAAAMQRLADYSEAEFTRRYRMPRERFDNIVRIIRPSVEAMTKVAIARAIASSGSVVKAELKLGATLRILSGGSYLDAADLHAIHDKSIYQTTVWPVCRAIASSADPELDTIHFPFENEFQLRRHEATFKKHGGHLFPGTVAVGDGCGLCIEQPSDKEVGGNVKDHHSRKYDYAYGFLLFCDGHNHIMSVEATHVSSAHDAAMYDVSKVHEAIENKKLPPWAHVLLDAAFACTEQELVPWPTPRNGLCEDKDAFNFMLSQQRQAVERTFGILQSRWGILWRPLRIKFDNLSLLLHTLCRLHNYCMQDRHVGKLTKIEDIAHEEDHRWKRGEPSGHMRLVLAQVQTPDQRQGRRTDLESSRRLEITNVIKRSGFKRPLISADAHFVGMLRDEFIYLSLGAVQR
jgi:transposase